MDNFTDTYTSANYRMVKTFVYGLVIFALLVGLSLYVSIQLHITEIGIIAWILICTVPFLFRRGFKRVFSRKTDLLFGKQGLLIKEYKSNGDLAKEYAINWNEIKSYRFQFMTDNVTNLVIIFKTRSTKSFFFIDEKYTKEEPDEISVYSLFVKYIKIYNAGKGDGEKILTKLNVFSVGTPDL